jgi:hypothetical protein
LTDLETVSCCIAQAGLKLMLLLPQSPRCWDYRRELPHLAQGVFNGIPREVGRYVWMNLLRVRTWVCKDARGGRATV